LLGQPPGHPAAAVERVSRVLLVDPPHQSQILGRLAGRLVGEARSVQAEQLALAADTQGRVADLDQRAFLLT
jgi:hypothetical protein